MYTGYHPKLNVRPVLNGDQVNYYQKIIGVLMWAVELGRILELYELDWIGLG